jgi:hypothetical protein
VQQDFSLIPNMLEESLRVETPVQFLPLSPERVRRTTPAEGLRSLAVIAWQRLTRPRRTAATATTTFLEPRAAPGDGVPATKKVSRRVHS